MSGNWWGRSSRPVEVSRQGVIWVGSICFTYLIGSIELLAADPGVALQNWYVLAIPMVLSAFRYGRLGAAISSGACLGMLVAIFHATGNSVEQVQGLLESLLAASSSAVDAQKLALQLADIRASNPTISFQRALIGAGILTVVTFLLGSSVDAKAEAHHAQERVLQRLRRYFSPRLVEYLTANEGDDEGLPTITLRKEISVLFTDLRDFTSLAEAAEPEEVLDLLNQYLQAMTEEIFKESGTLDKYTGDGLMAFFGDPGYYPDHAERAFRAALKMQARMSELHADWKARGWSTPHMGIGICTGHVTIGNIGSPSRMEYTALGSTANAAARLSSIAAPGEILTTVKTYSRVQHMVHGRPKGHEALKGFSQKVEIVAITGQRAIPLASDESRNERLAHVVSSVVEDPAYRAVILTDPMGAASGPRLDAHEIALARDVAFLCGYPLFRGLPAAEIMELLDRSAFETCGAGTAVVEQGGAADRLYVIIEGDMVVTASAEDGKEQHLASLSGGEIFGEISLLRDTPKTATVRSASICRLLVLQHEDARGFLDRAPMFRRRLESIAALRMRPTPEAAAR